MYMLGTTILFQETWRLLGLFPLTRPHLSYPVFHLFWHFSFPPPLPPICLSCPFAQVQQWFKPQQQDSRCRRTGWEERPRNGCGLLGSRGRGWLLYSKAFKPKRTRYSQKYGSRPQTVSNFDAVYGHRDNSHCHNHNLSATSVLSYSLFLTKIIVILVQANVFGYRWLSLNINISILLLALAANDNLT